MHLKCREFGPVTRKISKLSIVPFQISHAFCFRIEVFLLAKESNAKSNPLKRMTGCKTDLVVSQLCRLIFSNDRFAKLWV
jgi:hypothetical protein